MTEGEQLKHTSLILNSSVKKRYPKGHIHLEVYIPLVTSKKINWQKQTLFSQQKALVPKMLCFFPSKCSTLDTMELLSKPFFVSFSFNFFYGW